MDLVHIIVDTLVHGLDTAGDNYLSLKLLTLISADQRLQFFNELFGFFISDEFSRLNRVYQQF